MLNLPVYRYTVSMKSRLAIFLILLFGISIWLPFASAAEMPACNAVNGGHCDGWDSADDGTPNQQDWIEGVYEFNLVDTSTIEMEMTWALREFNRSMLGFDDDPNIAAALSAMGFSGKDGAPADLIRNFFDENTGGPGTPTVRQKLILEVNDTIEELLSSGFGSVNSINSAYTNSITESGVLTECSDDPGDDSIYGGEGASSENAFEPPICFSVTANVSLSTSTFNLGSVNPLTLERVYKGMLSMGSEITSEFDLFSEPGHKSVFVINPPDFATIKGVDANGIQVIKSGPPSYMAAQWTINHLDAPLNGQRIEQGVSIDIGHRNSTQTSSVVVGPDDTGITLGVTLDMSDEDAVYLEILAGINHIDESTMNDWGISMVDVTDNARVPWITSDGIRLAYHNDLVNLDDFTSNFPMDTVGDAIEDAVSGVSDITMGDMTWVSDSQIIGISEAPGGLNYSHPDCPESLPPGMDAYYCIEGQSAMNGEHPIYLRSVSSSFELRILDLIKEQVDDPTGLLDVIQESDFHDILDSGLTIDTKFGQDLLQDMIPSDLPPSELKLEIILPSWMQTATGQQSFELIERTNAEDQIEISIAKPGAYDPRHAILDEDGIEICSSDEADWSCVELDVELDVSELNFNEWGPSIDLTASFSAKIDLYRIKIPDEVLDELRSENTTIAMEVIPSDLIRLGFEIGGRLADPVTREVNVTEGNPTELEFTAEGFEAFVDNLGKEITEEMHKAADEASQQEEMLEIDLSGIQIITNLDNLGGIGTSMDDNTPITFEIIIPEFTFEAGVTNGWSGILDGEPTVGVTTALTNPIINAANKFRNLFQIFGLQFLQMSGSGLTLDNNGEPVKFQTDPVNVELSSETDTDLRGDVTFVMPDGIVLEDFQTANGWEKIEYLDDGRQQITISLESLYAGEDVEFRLVVTWLYILSQIWIYPTILLALIVWRVRARRKKKRRIREAKAAEAMAVTSPSKGGLSDSDFASLSAGRDPTMGGHSSDFDLYADDMWDQ